jgi:4-amino-4-deoxy-L-arabinose transferase-like glycosyltransferase
MIVVICQLEVLPMTEKGFLKMIGQERTQIYILIGLCAVLYFFNLSQWDLWNPDEPRYGQVAREIVNGGDWILMHNNGKMYTDKPPLFFWLIAFSSFLWQGFNSFSVRFPSAFFGTLTVLLTFLLGKKLSGPRSGFFSGLILATSFEFAYLATRANIDATLAFFTTASLFCFFEWHQGFYSPSPRPPISRTLSIYGFYVGMALATLTKGPVGFILPLLVSLIYLAVQRDWKRMKAMKLLPGFLLLLVIVLSWYLPAVWKGGQVYLNETLFKHTLNRYSGGWSHVRPFYYYFYNFPAQFLPWTLFLPGAFVYGFSEKEAEKRNAFLFFFVWFVVIFLFFSISKGKRELYVLPLYPAASVMVGKLLDDFLSKVTGRLNEKWITIPLYGWMAVMLLAGAAAPLVLLKKFPAFLACGIPIALLLIGGSLAMFLLIRSRKYAAIFFLIIGIVAGGFFYTLRVVFPLVNPYKSGRYISEEITSRIQPGERVGLFGGFGTGPYNFYTKIAPIEEMEQKDELFRFLQSPERVFCILKLRDFKVLQELADKPPLQLISQGSVGYDQIVLISNR